MKKAIGVLSALLVLVALAISSYGQTSEFMLASADDGAAVDTVTNTGSGGVTVRISGYQDVVAIQSILTKLSGTTAGVVRLFGSIDGQNYVRINTSDSLVATNVSTQSKVFTVSPHAYNFYRLTYVGSGSHSTTIQAMALTRKRL